MGFYEPLATGRQPSATDLVHSASIRGCRILVTAGPTWVPLDAVRYLGNRSSGRTGLSLAREFAAQGAAVTLMMGPGRVIPTYGDLKILDLRPFETFDDLHSGVRGLVGSRTFDALVHAAAVADYRPVSGPAPSKTPSSLDELVIRLVPTPKIVDEVKSLDPEIVLVKFKLESGVTEPELLRIAEQSRRHSGAELIVANDLAQIHGDDHPAWVLDASGLKTRVATEAELATELASRLSRIIHARGPRR